MHVCLCETMPFTCIASKGLKKMLDSLDLEL